MRIKWRIVFNDYFRNRFIAFMERFLFFCIPDIKGNQGINADMLYDLSFTSWPYNFHRI